MIAELLASDLCHEGYDSPGAVMLVLRNWSIHNPRWPTTSDVIKALMGPPPAPRAFLPPPKDDASYGTRSAEMERIVKNLADALRAKCQREVRRKPRIEEEPQDESALLVGHEVGRDQIRAADTTVFGGRVKASA